MATPPSTNYGTPAFKEADSQAPLVSGTLGPLSFVPLVDSLTPANNIQPSEAATIETNPAEAAHVLVPVSSKTLAHSSVHCNSPADSNTPTHSHAAETHIVHHACIGKTPMQSARTPLASSVTGSAEAAHKAHGASPNRPSETNAARDGVVRTRATSSSRLTDEPPSRHGSPRAHNSAQGPELPTRNDPPISGLAGIFENLLQPGKRLTAQEWLDIALALQGILKSISQHSNRASRVGICEQSNGANAWKIVQLLNKELPRLNNVFAKVIESFGHDLGRGDGTTLLGLIAAADVENREVGAAAKPLPLPTNGEESGLAHLSAQQDIPSSPLRVPNGAHLLHPGMGSTNKSLFQRKLNAIANTRPQKRPNQDIYSVPTSESSSANQESGLSAIGPLPPKKRIRQAPVSNSRVNSSDLERSPDKGPAYDQPPAAEDDARMQSPAGGSPSKATTRSPSREQGTASAEEEPPPRKETRRRSGSLTLGNKAQRKRIKDLAKIVRDHNGRPIPHLNRRREEELDNVDSDPDNQYLSTDASLSSSAVQSRIIARAIKRKAKAQKSPKHKVVVSHAENWNAKSKEAEATKRAAAAQALLQLPMLPFTTPAAHAAPPRPGNCPAEGAAGEESSGEEDTLSLHHDLHQLDAAIDSRLDSNRTDQPLDDIFQEADVASIIDVLRESVQGLQSAPLEPWAFSESTLPDPRQDELGTTHSPKNDYSVGLRSVDLSQGLPQLALAGEGLDRLPKDILMPSTNEHVSASQSELVLNQNELVLSQRPPREKQQHVPEVVQMAYLYIEIGKTSARTAARVHLGEIELHQWIEEQAPMPQHGTFIQHDPHAPQNTRQALITIAKEKLRSQLGSMVVGPKPSAKTVDRRLRSGKRWRILVEKFGLPVLYLSPSHLHFSKEQVLSPL